MIQQRRHKSNHGFSLLELMVVLGMVGLIIGLVAAQIDVLLPGTRLDAGAQLVADNISLAQSNAALDGKNVYIEYQLDKGYIQLKVLKETKRKKKPKWESFSPDYLPEDVEFEDIVLANGKKQTKGWLRISLSPLGTVTGHVVHLKTKSDRQVSIEVNPITCLVTISEGYQPLSFIEK